MPDKDQNITFETNPLAYCQKIYAEAWDHNQSYEKSIIENKEFYVSIDHELERRDKNVVRSNQFINEARPIIDTNYSVALDRLEEDNDPVRPDVDEETRDKLQEKYEAQGASVDELIDFNTKELNDDLVKSGYFYGEFFNHFMGTVFQPVSVVKISYEDNFKRVPRQLTFTDAEYWSYLLRKRRLPPKDKIVWRYENVGKKFNIDWLDWNELLYDPRIRIFTESYKIHRKMLSWEEVLNEARLHDWPMKKVLACKEKAEDETEKATTTEKTAQKDFNRPELGYSDGKYLVAEFWIPTYKQTGEKVIYRVVVLKNKEIMVKERNPHPGADCIFVDMKIHKQSGRIEGTPLMSILKSPQRLANDYFNAANDLVSLSANKPLKVPENYNPRRKPWWGSLALIDVPPGQDITPIEVDASPIQYLKIFIDEIVDSMRQLAHAPDIDQGINDKLDETATKTIKRVAGSARRYRPVAKAIAETISRIAKVMITMKQEDYLNWVLPDGADWQVDVPVLSGVYTPDEERNEALALYNNLKEDALYKNPAFDRFRRKLIERVLNKFRIKDIDEHLPSEDEIETNNKLMMNNLGGESGNLRIRPEEQAQINQV